MYPPFLHPWKWSLRFTQNSSRPKIHGQKVVNACWPYRHHLRHWCTLEQTFQERVFTRVVNALDAIIGRDQGLLGMSEPLEAPVEAAPQKTDLQLCIYFFVSMKYNLLKKHYPYAPCIAYLLTFGPKFVVNVAKLPHTWSIWDRQSKPCPDWWFQLKVARLWGYVP